MHLRRRLASLACILQLLCLAPCAGSILTQGIRDRPSPQQRTVRRTNGEVLERPNTIDPPMDLPPQSKHSSSPPSPLQLKYYDVVQVNVFQSATSEPNSPLTLLTAGAGEGKSTPGTGTGKPADAAKPPDAAKTLADQVAEGKYGLIHRELFQQRPQRFGVLSYRRNEEVPLDDERNYGGLQSDEIWLAEDHLLVLKGGSINNFNNAGGKGSNGSNRSSSSSSSSVEGAWKPIDDYRAPDRQVQIPLNPPVPPPFPVQLRENGPIEFIRSHQAAAFNPFTNESAFLFTNKAFPVIRPEDFGGQNLLARPAALNGTGQHNGLQYPAPVHPPPVSDNRTYSNPFLKLPPLQGVGGRLPGAVPPFGLPDDVQQNLTLGGGGMGGREEDVDDPSLYYPPPYSFEYKSNYTNPVPPGPLVPGIILPPPPNFFILKPTEPSKSEQQQQQQQQQQKEEEEAKTRAKTMKYMDRPKGAVSSSPSSPSSSSSSSVGIPPPVEIQKAVVKSFVPMVELYGSVGAGAAGTMPFRKPSATKRLRGKPTTTGPTLSRPATTASLPTTTTTPTVPVSTKLHKITQDVRQELTGSVGVGKPAPHPIYAEYFNIKSSTPASWGDTSFSTTPSRTYLPSKGQEGRVHEQQQQQQQHQHGELVRTYGYSPIEQFHREVNTIRQTLQIYEKANKLAKASRTSKAHQAKVQQQQQHHHQTGPIPALYHQHRQHAAHEVPGGRNLSLSFGGDNLYHAFYSDVVGGPIVASYKAYAASSDDSDSGAPVGANYGGYYEPEGPVYQVYKPTNVQELPHGYIVTTGEEAAAVAAPIRSVAFPRPYHSPNQPHYYQQRHRHLVDASNYHGQQPQQQQAAPPPPPPPPPPPSQQLSYIAPIILNNGASGYNRLPESHGGTTTKSYLILDHRTSERLRQRQQQQLVQQPYLRYRNRATGGSVSEVGYEHGGIVGGGEQELPSGNRYLEGDILVNYKHPLPALNPDSEYLPYQPHHHQRLQIRKRQNAGELTPSFFSSATQQAIYSQSGR